MIDETDLISLETEVRELIGEETAKFWTQARVFRAINAEVMRLARKIIDLDAGYMEQTLTTTPAATVSLPVNAYLVRNVELYIDSAWLQPLKIGDHQRGQYQALTSSTWPAAWMFENQSVTFVSGVSSASSLRIKYARLPASMLYATLSSGSTTTAVLSTASVIDDVYIGDKYVVLSGTGIGETLTCTDYVASTKTLTVAATATLDNTTVISTLLPEPLSKWPDLVAQGAALRLLPRRRDNDLYQMLSQGYAMDLSDMMNALSSRQTEQAMHGNYLPQEDEE